MTQAPIKAAVAQAEALAQEVGADIASVLITHFADAETLDTLRPGGPDLATVTAVNRAVATELAAQGVEVFVQLADRAAFRRWMQERDDTPQARRGWIDRARLLRGPEAFRLLGAAPPKPPAPPRFAAAPGPIADRLLAAFLRDDGETFADTAEALLAAARRDVLELAVRKAAEREGDDAADALELALLAIAEGARIGPSGWAGLVTLPVALPPGTPPDAVAMGEALARSGIPADTVELRFLPGWRAPDTLAALSPMTIRRILLDLVQGIEPRDLPPADTDDLATRGFGALFGLELDWDIPIWDEIAATGLPDEEDDESSDEATPDEARRAALFDSWRGAVFDAHGGCVPLALVPPSELGAEIASFLDEAGQHTDGIDEIREFIAMARGEAGGEEVVCRAEIIGTGLELSLYAASGRFLDSLTLTADRLPAAPEEMLRVIASFVRLVPNAPG